jgi:hypothetical protein
MVGFDILTFGRPEMEASYFEELERLYLNARFAILYGRNSDLHSKTCTV